MQKNDANHTKKSHRAAPGGKISAKYLLFGMSCQKCAVLAVPALGAEALVFHIVHRVDGDLRTFKDKLAVDLTPVADGLASAGTNRLDRKSVV